ncbi:MAG: hypothetical protein LBC17_01730 [Lactobacillaceae bacterium]|jgi:hypothetical protein|nr:hypothetical protein [Lactobacillaceae bacterium]
MINSQDLIFIRSTKNGTLLADQKNKKVYFTPEILPESMAHHLLLWAVIISGILVTPYWIATKIPQLNIPHLIMPSGIFWWLGLVISLLIPYLLWLFGKQKKTYDINLIKPFNDTNSVNKIMTGWFGERLWVIIVLFLLPPTVLLFVWLYFRKSDSLDLLLIILHWALFFRRLTPHAFTRIFITEKQIKNWVK